MQMKDSHGGKKMDIDTKHPAIITDSGVDLVKDVLENSRSSR